MKPNVMVKSNVWINPKDLNGEYPHAARDYIPGDLMVSLLRTRDTRTLERHMTRRQIFEYKAYRFFLYRGQSGKAVEER